MDNNNTNEAMQEQQFNEQDLQQQSGRPSMMGGGQMNGRPPMPPQGGQFGEQPQSDSETESTTEV